MGKLSFALGALAGMAMNAKENRAHNLNEIGIQLANEYRYEEALTYFREAHKLMPTELSIKNNILICKKALIKMDEYKEQEEELKKQKEREKLQRLREKALKKPKKPVNLDKFPIETEKLDKSNSNWCNSCCSHIPKDVDCCPYCGSMSIKTLKTNNNNSTLKMEKTSKEDLNCYCNNCYTYISENNDYCPHCGSIDIKRK